MSKKNVRIKGTSLAPRLPVTFAIVWWLLLDRLDAPGWAYGVLGSVVVLAFTVWVMALWRCEFRDVPGFGEQG